MGDTTTSSEGLGMGLRRFADKRPGVGGSGGADLSHRLSPAARNPVPLSNAASYTLIIAINPSATDKFGIGVDIIKNPGHTIVALKNPQGKLEKVFSYGPRPHRATIECSHDAETNYPLDKKDMYTIFEFSITGVQRNKVLQKMKEIEDNPGTFDASDQCTTKSLEVVRAAGLLVPNGKGRIDLPFFCPNPGQVPTPINLDKELLHQFPNAKKVPATYFSGFVQFK